MPPENPATRTYQPELMGIRAVAIGLVVLDHWTLGPFAFGEMGQLLFLVLSGYLISGLIWKNDIYWGSEGNWSKRLGVFYLRRALRIMPAYYAALALGALLPLVTLWQYPLWFVLPAANLLCYRLQTWPEGLGHYWTLALEEQFYLLWPLLLTLLRRLRVPTAGLWCIAGASLLFRILWVWAIGPGFATVLLPACLDLFAAGALVRLHAARTPGVNSHFLGWFVIIAWGAWVGLWGWAETANTAASHAYVTIGQYVLGAVGGYCTLRWLLTAPPAARWLRHPLVQWLGTRSYGLYLYHLMLPVFYQRLVYHFLPASQSNAVALRQFWLAPIPTVLLLTPLLLAMSAASWHFLEAPLDKFRRRFVYTQPTPLQPVANS
jgi:peptidoglycan/LPS O-acetylase OafA/YrhL